jgi:SAM-dependent methyltransferase
MDPRATTADVYDLSPVFPDDIPFYLEHLPGPDAAVLELGCGTGRVSASLAAKATFVHGVDLSPAMITRCETRFREAGLSPDQARATVGDITNLRLERRFDFVVAPFRVVQNLTTDSQIAGIFATIRTHLTPAGSCILNVFRPYADPATLQDVWSTPGESVDWERVLPDGTRLVCSVRRAGASANPLIIYPDLIYRRYQGNVVVDEAVSSIAMRCWYPEQFVALVRHEGFRVTGQWGGYAGEQYGSGPELIVAFTDA